MVPIGCSPLPGSPGGSGGGGGGGIRRVAGDTEEEEPSGRGDAGTGAEFVGVASGAPAKGDDGEGAGNGKAPAEPAEPA